MSRVHPSCYVLFVKFVITFLALSVFLFLARASFIHAQTESILEGTVIGGGVFRGIDGITIYIPKGISCEVCEGKNSRATFSVFVKRADDPTKKYPLPDDLEAISPFYLIGSSDQIRSPTGEMLRVSFPIPLGIEINNVSLLTLEPTVFFIDAYLEEDDPEFIWWFPDIDDDDLVDRKLTEETAVLIPQGITYVLVKNHEE
jgi:hypothetical protein